MRFRGSIWNPSASYPKPMFQLSEVRCILVSICGYTYNWEEYLLRVCKGDSTPVKGRRKAVEIPGRLSQIQLREQGYKEFRVYTG